MTDVLKLQTETNGTAHYSFRTTLDGVDYQLELDWSSREERWYLSVLSAEGQLLSGRTKVLSNWPMLRYYHHRVGVPAGELIAVNTGSNDAPPGLYELGIGARCELTYFPLGTLVAR
jgi:hypothetical protein